MHPSCRCALFCVCNDSLSAIGSPRRFCRSDLLGLKRPLVHLFVHDDSSGCCCQQQQVNYKCSCRNDCRSLRCRWLLSPRHRHNFESKRAMQSPLHAHAAAWKARWVLNHYYRLLRCICITPLDVAGRTESVGGRGAKVSAGVQAFAAALLIQGAATML